VTSEQETDDLSVLYLTTRDIERPRTGADNRTKYLFEGLYDTFPVDVIYFDRTADGQGSAGDEMMSVPYPASEVIAILSLRFLHAVLRTIRQEEYDVVVTSGIGAVTYGIIGSLIMGTPFVFDDHNAEFELAQSGSLLRFVVVYLLERAACGFATVVVVPTDKVRTTLAPWIRGDSIVVTNGYNAKEFTPEGEARDFDEQTIFFFGNFNYKPNIEAVEYIIETLCPQLDDSDTDVSVLLAGPGYETIRDTYQLPERVELLGFVEDLPATIRGADLVVVPLHSGRGSRLKIIESLACGTRVVSTPIGADGWPTEWENLVLVEFNDFADKTIKELSNRTFDFDEYEKITRYSWQSQSRYFANYIKSTIQIRE
jgi:glycosyltransferase involved in cell wall biosynthesis